MRQLVWGRRRRAGAVRLLVVGALVAGACGGPRVPLGVTMKGVSTDIVLGAANEATVGATLSPPVAPAPFVAAEVRPSTPTTVAFVPPRQVPKLDACPKADVTAPIRHEAFPTISAPPMPRQYLYLATISSSLGSATNVPETRTVKNVVGNAGDATWDVDDAFGPIKKTTTFHLVSSSPLPGGNGIFITKEVSSAPGLPTSTLTWTPEVQVLQLPAVTGTSWTVASTDTATKTFESFTATISGQNRVDACGTPLTGWHVDLTGGRYINGVTNLTFTGAYDFGTQYGGVILHDSVDQSGTIGVPPSPFSLKSDSRITQEPATVG